MSTHPLAPAPEPGRRRPLAASIDEALPLLRRPFAPAAVRAKVQAQERGPQPGWGQVIRYIDARLVCDRLNHVAGGAWTAQYTPLDAALHPAPDGYAPSLVYVVCRLTVLGQAHEDVGEGRDPKAAFSDALKRAAVPFGIGRSIYAVPRRFMRAQDATHPPADTLRRRGDKLVLTEVNEALLRREYEGWLEQVGTEAFGEVLDHGPDADGGDDGDPDPAGPVGQEEAPEPSRPARGGLRAVPSGPAAAPATIH